MVLQADSKDALVMLQVGEKKKQPMFCRNWRLYFLSLTQAVLHLFINCASGDGRNFCGYLRLVITRFQVAIISIK